MFVSSPRMQPETFIVFLAEDAKGKWTSWLETRDVFSGLRLKGILKNSKVCTLNCNFLHLSKLWTSPLIQVERPWIQNSRTPAILPKPCKGFLGIPLAILFSCTTLYKTVIDVSQNRIRGRRKGVREGTWCIIRRSKGPRILKSLLVDRHLCSLSSQLCEAFPPTPQPG